MKSYFIIILTLFISVHSGAQNINEFNDSLEYYIKQGQADKAITIGEKVLEAVRQQVSENHPYYDSLLNILATFCNAKGQYEKAESLYIRLLQIRKNLLGESRADYATTLNDLAVLYKNMGQYDKAESLNIESLEIKKEVLGEAHPACATSMNNLALLYQIMGQYEKAEPLFIRAIEINKKALGATSLNYATNLNNLALLYKSMGQYEKAESLYIQSKEIMKKVLGENHATYATSLNNLAEIYRSMGQYEKAESLYIQSKEIRKKIWGENHPVYAQSLNNLAAFYQTKGQYEKAESLYIQSKEILKKVLGENHPDYAACLNNLGMFYEDLGQYEKAEQYFVQSMIIKKKVLGENHPDYAMSLINLAGIYEDLSQYEKVESLYVLAKEILKKVFGENHPLYSISLNNLALLYESRGQYESAEPLYIQSIEITKKMLGEKHSEYAQGLYNLAVLYESMGRYEKAEPLFVQGIEIMRKALGEIHPSYVNGLENLAALYEGMGRYEKAEPLNLQINQIVINNLVNNFTIFSEKEKENYLNNKIKLLETNNNFVYRYKKASTSVLINNFNLQLIFKSITLADTRNMLLSSQKSNDTVVQQLMKDWQAAKNIMSRQYSLPVFNRRKDLKQIETNTENLEKELSSKSSAFRNQQNAIRISLQDVQKRIQQDEVAIEFVRFRLYNEKWTDSTIYAAYILSKSDSIPVFVPLCEEKQLGNYFSSASGAATIKSIYRSDAADEDEKPGISGDSLYALIWKPLMPYLKDVKKINYSPAGLLYKVAFHALPAGDSLLLMDKYELNQYTSTRQLALAEEKKSSNTSIALFGNCQFTMDSTAIVKNIPASEKANTLITAKITRSENTGGWKTLSGTADEIKNIQILFDNNKISTSAFTQEKATEEQFKSLSGNSPLIIHLATHGFFLPDPEKKKQEGFAADKRNAFTLADDPLLRSGIVLSGANRVWSGKAPIEGREDGIVTAYEIAQMDLSKTDLVVLSACETALGDIKGNEGVFGLQRAFKLAGVKNMLLSLWKVPDAETAELMKDFYTYYLQGKTARESFAAAQKDMRKKYKPYYWAAFVLIE